MVEFNKMFVMLPVMFLARKLDGEDPLVVYWLRVAYVVVQVICVLAVGYTYLQASTIAKSDASSKVVYVPPAAAPFADPNAKKKYTEIAYGTHIVSTARSLLGSTLFGIVMTIGLHYYKGMVMGLAIQAVMAPFNLAENALVKAVFMGGGSIQPESKIFSEKTAAELSPDDEVVDESGNPVVRSVTAGGTTTVGGGTAGAIAAAKDATAAAKNKQPRELEDILLDTWDAGAKADLSELMGVMTKKNCNYQTKEDRWSALMVLAGIGAKGTAGAIRQVQELGGNPAVVDKEGWNALHWAAFHGSVEAAKELRKETKLLTVKDKEGQTPVDSARKEGNNEVADIFEQALGDTKKSK